MPRELEAVYHGADEPEDMETLEVESDSGFGILIVNRVPDSDMNRKEVRDYVHKVIAEHRHELSSVDSRIRANHEGCLIGLSPVYSIPDAARPILTRPLKITHSSYNRDTSRWLQQILGDAGLMAVLQEVPFLDTLYNPDVFRDTDLNIHGEVFENNQTFSYYYFLLNSYSPMQRIIQRDARLKSAILDYPQIPFER
ncbi:hypothetical protein [Peribacillus kribbensis]|uniref:hypothetical protein n=1 Tax=Peribacillus kribbensis TaxID=356658 RepID=UPI0006874AC0|nr:hypothetical protein [Peribacillus kribbensis]